jgi:hypothetical protein
MKDERPLIGGKDFHNFQWIRKINSRKVHGKFMGEKFFLSCVFVGRGGK